MLEFLDFNSQSLVLARQLHHQHGDRQFAATPDVLWPISTKRLSTYNHESSTKAGFHDLIECPQGHAYHLLIRTTNTNSRRDIETPQNDRMSSIHSNQLARQTHHSSSHPCGFISSSTDLSHHLVRQSSSWSVNVYPKAKITTITTNISATTAITITAVITTANTTSFSCLARRFPDKKAEERISQTSNKSPRWDTTTPPHQNHYYSKPRFTIG